MATVVHRRTDDVLHEFVDAALGVLNVADAPVEVLAGALDELRLAADACIRRGLFETTVEP